LKNGVLVLFVAAACSRSPAGAVVHFVENDYARALADARGRGVPLFIDAWASWCHTCLSMRAYVFTDPVLRPYERDFAWLAIDTERQENAALVEKLGIHVLPTLVVLDAASEQPLVAWPGSMTARELAGLLEASIQRSMTKSATADADGALKRGHRASADGRNEEAISDYRAALATAPPGWPHRAEALDAWVTVLGNASHEAECAKQAVEAAPGMAPGTPLADVLRAGIHCAVDSLPDAAALSALDRLLAQGEQVAGDATQPILPDDRSDLFGYVVSGLSKLARKDELARVARAWAAFLEEQATHAPSPSSRAVFDAHRLEAYLALGRPEQAVPMLEESERDFPQDYNPPARLGVALLAMGRYDEAIAALDRALHLAYGPRKLRLWSVEADAFRAKGDRDGERRALQAAVDFSNTVPLTGGYPKSRDALQRRLIDLADRGAR
jgi:tetratricopeptide (TPR) repeat protein